MSGILVLYYCLCSQTIINQVHHRVNEAIICIHNVTHPASERVGVKELWRQYRSDTLLYFHKNNRGIIFITLSDLINLFSTKSDEYIFEKIKIPKFGVSENYLIKVIKKDLHAKSHQPVGKHICCSVHAMLHKPFLALLIHVDNDTLSFFSTLH